MQAAEMSPSFCLSGQGEAGVDRSTWFSTLTYRSRSIGPVSELELQRLLRSAQIRNRSEGLTGLLIYDKGRFFQWLEGPAEGMKRVWDSLKRDPRHTDIEVMGNEPTAVRCFADWDMKLCKRPPGNDSAAGDAFDITPELIEGLYRHPDAAPALLARLAPIPPAAASSMFVDKPTGPALAALVKHLVIPRLVARHALLAQPALSAVGLRATELARLLIAVDPSGARALMVRLQPGALSAELAEPTARALGDLWQADECSELDITFGLGRLQTAMRQAGASVVRRALPAPLAVLVAPAPGESHILLAALDADVLWNAGWDTNTEFPVDDAALGDMLAGAWFDALDLSLSATFRREHRLPRLAATIASARAASRNPALVIVVGGRVFGEPGDADVRIGADANVASSAQVETMILRGLNARAAIA